MRKALIAIGIVIAVILVILFVVPLLIPADVYKDQVIARIEQATGRKARIDGDFSLSLIPRVEFVAGKVSLSNAPGMQPAEMVTLGRLDVRVAILPLLHGELVVDSFVLQKPVIHLIVDRQGRPNWQFAATRPAPERPAPREKPEKPAQKGGGIGLSELSLGDVRLVDGRVTYADARTGTSYLVSDVNASVSLPSLSAPMKADGSLVWNGQKLVLELDVDNPGTLLDGRMTPVSVKLTGNPLKLTFRGKAATGKQTRVEGNVDLDVPSVRKLAAWAGKPLKAPGSGYGPLKIVGQVDMKGNRIAFRQARLALDSNDARGDFQYDGGGKTPVITARLSADKLDLNPYLPPSKETGPPAAGPKPAPAGAPAPAAEGWSTTPIDLSALRRIDADLGFSVGGLVMRKIAIGKSQLKVTLKDGRLVTALTQMALYGGNGTARLTADATGRVPAIAAKFDLSDIQANPLLSAVMGFERLEGTGNIDLDIASKGASQRALVGAVNGKGKISFRDGAVRGIDIGALIRTVQNALSGQAVSGSSAQKTDFSSLSGSFTIKQGVLRNDDLALKSPLLRMTGKGTVNLPTRMVDFRIEPRLVASTKGQGGKSDVAGLGVPILVQGPWTNLSYKPDLSGAIRNLGKNPKIQNELKKILPGGGSKNGGAPAGPLPNPADALKKLFGR